MKEVLKTYTIRKKYKHKCFTIPASIVDIDGSYTVEEINDGVKFTLAENAPYKVTGEATDKKGRCRYGVIKFQDDSWTVGDKYTVTGNKETIEIKRYKTL